MAEAWLRKQAALDNTEITDFGFGIGPNGEKNAYMSSRMPAKKSNFSMDRQNVIDNNQKKNKQEVVRREHENTMQYTKNQNSYHIWENAIQEKIFLKQEQDRAEARQILNEDRFEKMMLRREAYAIFAERIRSIICFFLLFLFRNNENNAAQRGRILYEMVL